MHEWMVIFVLFSIGLIEKRKYSSLIFEFRSSKLETGFQCMFFTFDISKKKKTLPNFMRCKELIKQIMTGNSLPYAFKRENSKIYQKKKKFKRLFVFRPSIANLFVKSVWNLTNWFNPRLNTWLIPISHVALLPLYTDTKQ